MVWPLIGVLCLIVYIYIYTVESSCLLAFLSLCFFTPFSFNLSLSLVFCLGLLVIEGILVCLVFLFFQRSRSALVAF